MITKIEYRLQTVSASKIKTYRTCSKKYEYTYINKPEVLVHTESKNIGALLGSSLHRAIEMKYKENADPLTTFTTFLDKTYAEWETAEYIILGEEWLSKSVKTGREILRDFDWDVFQPIDLERHFTLPFPSADNPICNMTGIIDLIDARGWVVDHKSQKETPTQEQLDNDAQFIIYYWAHNEMFNEYPARVIWNNLRTGTLIDIDIATNYNDKLQQLTSDIQTMLTNTAYARKLLDRTCLRECNFYRLCWQNKESNTDGSVY